MEQSTLPDRRCSYPRIESSSEAGLAIIAPQLRKPFSFWAFAWWSNRSGFGDGQSLASKGPGGFALDLCKKEVLAQFTYCRSSTPELEHQPYPFSSRSGDCGSKTKCNALPTSREALIASFGAVVARS
ncbi:hypothetical protein TWF718_000598 [Orbilia javanica]|uniref:Uncharacterized protein n=1 Tax=Orbilia javanica TaxID=47235 RepID=A0AAN8MZK3_9PEZI